MITTIKISLARWQQLFKWTFMLVSMVTLLLSYPLLKNGFVLETDLQNLFPQDDHNQLVNNVNDRLYREFGNKILVAVQSTEIEQVNLAAELVAAAITANPLLQVSEASEQLKLAAQQNELLQQHRYHLLTPAQQRMISSQQQDVLGQAQAALFGFSAGGSALSPLQDPLSLSPAYIQQLQPAIKGELINDRLVVSNSDGHLILFALNLQGESFNLQLQAQMNTWLQNLRDQLAANPKTPATRVLVSGAVFHAAEASANAQREMTMIGGGSSLGVLLLFMLAFRRIKPLLLSLISVGYGCLVALVVNHFLFGKIHLMTLVFGASLIGVAVDYSLHYLCKYQDLSRTIPDAQNRGDRVLEKLLPALSLSLIASALGYSSLLPTPLPGLQQIALFSVMGLCGSWLFLVVTYPRLVRQPLPEPAAIIDRCATAGWIFWEAMRGLPQRVIFAGVALLIIIGAATASLSSDVRTLYKPSAQLMASEQQLHNALQGVAPNQYFLLRAKSAEELLQTEERFRSEHLEALVAEGALNGYIATSAIVPSMQQQNANYELLHQQVYRANGLVSQFMQSAGFDAQAIAQAEHEFAAAAQQYLHVDDWLKIARPDQGLLWMGESHGDYVSIIGLRGVADVKALSAAANDSSVMWIDRVASMSQLLRTLMHSAAVLLLLAYLAILPLLWIYFRRRQALLLIFVPLMATITTLSLLSVSGVEINLFHLFGCYLILGLGMDYGIFSYTQGTKDRVTQRAIWLSAVSSSLSFGLLALSSTPMVSAFGITLFLGCCFNLLYAPLAGQLNNSSALAGAAQ
ncbi:MMPL family transporter [Cellvibrio fibrivorans]|uniref:Exporter n=1 Tax=Cellvibrio fibrivorans TaxID=126350 RepID=A0ABU1UUD1_9GAMM|nr:MMPL family transporter [Cellvibrio fibrivorans]MDR7088786.1 putative exporter [Cellvibrio fibrivorans]